MIYEIRVRNYMGAGSKSLGKYFKDKDNADEYVKELNVKLNLYYVSKIKLEDNEG